MMTEQAVRGSSSGMWSARSVPTTCVGGKPRVGQYCRAGDAPAVRNQAAPGFRRPL